MSLIDGKKATIVSILSLVIVFLLGRGYIQKDLADLLSGVLVLLAGSANVRNFLVK